MLQSLYTTVFSQKFSPDGSQLAICDNYGQISIYKLNDVLRADDSDRVKPSHTKFKVSNDSLYVIESAADFLLCAPVNELIGWKWKDLANANEKGTNLKKSFRLRFNNRENEKLETNTILYDQKTNNKKLFSGCGNGEINCFDVEYSKLINKYLAHSDSIYQLAFKNSDNELVSASEDGNVKIWDIRSKEAVVSSIRPFEHAVCARPNLGKHVTTLAVDDDNWLICGGGPRLSMWHLRSMKPMSTFDFQNELFMPNVCRIHENQILSGGNVDSLFIHTFENRLKTQINTTCTSIFDIAISSTLKLNKIVFVAGAGPAVDIVSNSAYKALSLTV